MGMRDYERAVALIHSAEGGDFVGPRPSEWIAAAEKKLSLQFPPTFRRFLKELGCGGFRGEEFYGVVGKDFEHGSIPDAIWLTLRQRKAVSLPTSLVIVQSTGDGNWYAVDLSRSDASGEAPIVFVDLMGLPGEIVAEDFGRFFLDRISFAAA